MEKEIMYLKTETEVIDFVYNWYTALLHGGRYIDLTGNVKEIFKENSLIGKTPDQFHDSLNQKKECIQIFVNRLIFLKFLQMYNILSKEIFTYLKNKPTNTLKNTIDLICFNVLNTKLEERDNDIPKIFKTLPFLNHPLFEQVEFDYIYEDKLRGDIIHEFLKFIDSFDSFEQISMIKSISPDILGFVFEKEMNTDFRKRTGAYYTPKDFTTFLSEKLLFEYLLDHTKFLFDNLEKIKKITNTKELFNVISLKEMEIIYEKIIMPLKLCDNACGSGAFLLSGAESLFRLSKKISQMIGKKESDFQIKKRILRKNIFGVDINKRAIEVAKLRLWLWAISSYPLDNDAYHSFPKIEYNLKAGNSLIGFTSFSAFSKNINNLLIFPLKEEIDLFKQKIEAYKNEEKINRNEITIEYVRLKEKIDEVYRTLHSKEIKHIFQTFNGLKTHLETSPMKGKYQIKFKFRTGFPKKLVKILGLYSPRVYTNSINVDLNSKTDLIRFNKESFDVELIKQIDLEKEELILIKTPTIQELSKMNCFHWFLEFPEVYFDTKLKSTGFDIFLGNPPFGSTLISDQEKRLIQNEYDVHGCGDYCGYFVERQLQLGKKLTYLGNVLAESFIVNENMASVRDYVMKRGSFFMAFFGSRPSKIFVDNEKRISMIFGKTIPGKTKTTRNIRFHKNERENLLQTLCFHDVDHLFLGSKIGVYNSNNAILPKIGNKTTFNILQKLKHISQKNSILHDYIEEKHTDYYLQYRSSAGYWTHALEKFPYHSTTIKTIFFNEKYIRDFCILILNSSLFYLYWTIYGNNRNIRKNLISSFPIPNLNCLEKKKQEINEKKDLILHNQLSVFDPKAGTFGEFHSLKIKNIIDIIDDFLVDFYGFTLSEKEYIQMYDRNIRSNNNE